MGICICHLSKVLPLCLQNLSLHSFLKYFVANPASPPTLHKPCAAWMPQLNGNAPCPGATFRVITPDKITIKRISFKFRQRARFCCLGATALLFHAFQRTFTHQGTMAVSSPLFLAPCCLFLCSLLPVRLFDTLGLQCACSVRAE